MSETGAKDVAVLLTPGGGGAAIAVVRLRGAGTAGFLGKYFSRNVLPGTCAHGEISDGGNVIDDALVMVSEDGAGEISADLNVHGGAWIVGEVMGLARREGFEIVEQSAGSAIAAEAVGEEGDSILEREMLACLPFARTEMAIRELLAQPGIWKAVMGERNSIDAAGLDIGGILVDESLWWLLNLPQVAIVGEANVGKSTLANRLFAQERSITADVAGTTRDWVGEIANIDGLAVTLVDTPGVRETADELERAAIGASAGKISESDLVICVLDATREPGKESRELMKMKGAMVVVNKIDQAAGWDFRSMNAVEISAKNGDGVDLLRKKILERFGIGEGREAKPRWWTRRQKEILGRGAAGEMGI